MLAFRFVRAEKLSRRGHLALADYSIGFDPSN
jgi:hypothetical protein